MKQIYSLTTLAIALTLFAQTSSAQTYTAVLPGNWHTTSGPGIWQAAEPPASCSGCHIVIDVPGTVVLNTSIQIDQNSSIVIGGTNGTILSIGNSNSTDFANSYSIILVNDGTNSTMNLANNNVILNATGAGDYDGILTKFPNGATPTYFKQIGNAPSGFVGNTIASTGKPGGGQTAFGPVTLSSTGTLPILLSGFNATLSDGSVKLSWSTQMEINSDHFAIERSTDAGAHWAVIGVVAAHGNSSTVLNYSFSDNKTSSGTSEYRLQMVDKDAKYAYSEVKTIRNGLITAVSVYPNPARDYVNVTLGGSNTQSAVVRLLNQSGQLLLEKNVSNAGGTTVPLAVSSYPQGNYIILVIGADGSKQVSKLLISK